VHKRHVLVCGYDIWFYGAAMSKYHRFESVRGVIDEDVPMNVGLCVCLIPF
jgi:hypothetical protein